MRRLPVIVLTVLAAAPLAAQDTTVTKDQPIRIGVDYAVNRPGLVVLPGTGLDTVRAMVQRDLDYTDRFEMLGDFTGATGPAGSDGPSGTVNYGIFKTMGVFREFLGRRDALKEIVLGRAPGTEEFDVIDAAGFSAAIPGVIHYDVLRPDARMTRLLDAMYADYGITRLGEGGMVANVPARVAWETCASGQLGRRNSFVLALDCFAPGGANLAWYALQQLVRSSNVDAHRPFADLYIDFPQTLSPMNLVPPLRDVFLAMRWGRARLEPHLPFIKAMMRPIPVLSED